MGFVLCFCFVLSWGAEASYGKEINQVSELRCFSISVFFVLLVCILLFTRMLLAQVVLEKHVCLELGVFLAQAIRRKLASIHQLLLCSCMVMSAWVRQWVMMLSQFLGGTKSVVTEREQDRSQKLSMVVSRWKLPQGEWRWGCCRGPDWIPHPPWLVDHCPPLSALTAAGLCLQGLRCQCFSYSGASCCLTLCGSWW